MLTVIVLDFGETQVAGLGIGANILVAVALASLPAPAAACGVGETMIFFDRGSTEIRRDQSDRLDGFAAQAWWLDGDSSVLVSGFTDSLGAAAANLDLARRRAESVRNYLQARGIPAVSIALNPVGEAVPLLPTPDGVDEPQNRRVTLLVRMSAEAAEARRRAEREQHGGAIPLC